MPTAKDFTRFMANLMCDSIEGRVTPAVVNATCKVASNMLKAVEMEMKYGTNGPVPGAKTLYLTGQEGA